MKKMLVLTGVLPFVVALPELVGNVLGGGLLYDNWIEGVEYVGKLANDNSWKISIKFPTVSREYAHDTRHKLGLAIAGYR